MVNRTKLKSMIKEYLDQDYEADDLDIAADGGRVNGLFEYKDSAFSELLAHVSYVISRKDSIINEIERITRTISEVYEEVVYTQSLANETEIIFDELENEQPGITDVPVAKQILDAFEELNKTANLTEGLTAGSVVNINNLIKKLKYMFDAAEKTKAAIESI